MVVLPPICALLLFLPEYSEASSDFTVELDFKTFDCLEAVSAFCFDSLEAATDSDEVCEEDIIGELFPFSSPLFRAIAPD